MAKFRQALGYKWAILLKNIQNTINAFKLCIHETGKTTQNKYFYLKILFKKT